MRTFLPAALVAFLSLSALAQTADLIGTAGRYGYETGTRGAVLNRQMADQLYKQALADEAQAWRTFPPNVSLLSKALQESREAKLADDQAKEFARAALHGANSGAQSGEFSNSRYGMVDEKKLKELATTNSPYMKQVEGKLGSYGMKLSSDKMSLQTPFGKFNVDTDGGAFEKAVGAIAQKLGYSANEVNKGFRAAEAARNSMAKELKGQLEREVPTVVAGENPRGPATAGRSPASAVPAEEEKAIGSEAGSAMVKDFEKSSTVKSWDEIQKEISDNRRALGRSLGMQAENDPLGRRNQDIFQMVHVRYQSLRAKGAFIELIRPRP